MNFTHVTVLALFTPFKCPAYLFCIWTVPCRLSAFCNVFHVSLMPCTNAVKKLMMYSWTCFYECSVNVEKEGKQGSRRGIYLEFVSVYCVASLSAKLAASLHYKKFKHVTITKI